MQSYNILVNYDIINMKYCNYCNKSHYYKFLYCKVPNDLQICTKNKNSNVFKFCKLPFAKLIK